MKQNTVAHLSLSLACFTLLAGTAIGATRTWTDAGGGDHLWSNSGNWDGATPGINDIANFDSTATGTNIVDSNMSVDQLYYGQTAGNMAFETQIGSGITLTNAMRLYLSYNESGGLSPTCRVDVTGSGVYKAGNYMMMVGGRESGGGIPNATMVFNGINFAINTLDYFYVGYANHVGGPPAYGTLDLSQAASVTSGGNANSLIVANDFWIGYRYGYGELKLPPSVTTIRCGNLKMGNGFWQTTPDSVLDLGTNPALTSLTVSGDVMINKGLITYNDGSTARTSFPPAVSVKIGSSGAPANLNFACVYAQPASVRWSGFRRFEAWLNQLYLGVGDNSGTAYGELDLADANTTELGGSFTNSRMSVADVRLGGLNMNGTGVLKLPGNMTNITVGTLRMGYMDNLNSPIYSVIHLGSNSQLRELVISNEFRMGRAQFEYLNASGNSVTGTPPGLRISIGAQASPASVFYIGDAVGQGATTYFGSGATSFRAYAIGFNVGRGYGGNHWSIGQLDLRSVTNLFISVSRNFEISAYSEAYGYVYLSGGPMGGRVSCSNLYMNTSGSAWAAHLVLSNAQFTVSNEVVVKSCTYGGKITNYVGQISSGIDLCTTNLTLPDAGMHIVFKANPPDQILPCWGLRLKGDHIDFMKSLTTATAKVTFDISSLSAKYQSRFGIFYEPRTDTTILGIPSVVQGSLYLVH